MKKIIILFVILAIIGGAGAGYYFFFMQDDSANDADKTEAAPVEQKPMEELVIDLAPEPENTHFYVSSAKLDIMDRPSEDGIVIGMLYKTEPVEVLEKRDGWARITDYLVYTDGQPEQADWVNMAFLVEEKPTITKQERMETLDSYIVESDDLKDYRAEFRIATDKLLKKGACEPKDFEELRGWVRSINYKDRPVYFIYCDGLDLENKIYLDVSTGKLFNR